jgi:hypothetical protein
MSSFQTARLQRGLQGPVKCIEQSPAPPAPPAKTDRASSVRPPSIGGLSISPAASPAAGRAGSAKSPSNNRGSLQSSSPLSPTIRQSVKASPAAVSGSSSPGNTGPAQSPAPTSRPASVTFAGTALQKPFSFIDTTFQASGPAQAFSLVHASTVVAGTSGATSNPSVYQTTPVDARSLALLLLYNFLRNVHPALAPLAEPMVAQGFTTVESLTDLDRDCCIYLCREFQIPWDPMMSLLKNIAELKSLKSHPAGVVPAPVVAQAANDPLASLTYTFDTFCDAVKHGNIETVILMSRFHHSATL